MDADDPDPDADADDGNAGGERPGEEIAPLAAVPTDSTHLFTVRDVHADTEVEAILVRTDGGNGDGNGDGSASGADSPGDGAEVAAWLNYCQHWTDVRLDTGSGATRRDGEIVCGRHGATFEADTGRCDFGPCEGAYLDEVTVAVADGAVRLTDPDYEFRHEGPVEEEDDLDLSTNPGGRLGF
jgi:nitrite reductase/ring-hydroxylating ferredoxin subunit